MVNTEKYSHLIPIDSFEDEKKGLIFAWEILGDGTGRNLDWKEVENGWHKEGLYWLHFNFGHPFAQKWLIERSGIPKSLLPYLLASDSRPGAFVHDDKLLMILRGINFNEGSAPEDLISLRLYLAPNQLLSMRIRKVQSIEVISHELEQGLGVCNSGQFLSQVVTKIIDRIGDYVDKLEDQVVRLERAIVKNDKADISDELKKVQSEIIDLRRYLHPQRLMFVKLLDQKFEWINDDSYNQIRTQIEFHIRHVEAIEYCWERTQVIKEDLAARQNERLNQKLYILAIVSCIFLPLSLITGLLGVNVAGIPFAENHFSFAALSAGLMMLAAVILLYFKGRKWF